MALIENISDDVITIFLIVFTIFLVVISWLSTNVREFPFPGNLLVIERNSRRFYTTSDGNRSLVTSQNTGIPLATTGTVQNNSNSNGNNSVQADSVLIVAPTSRQSSYEPSTTSDQESSFSLANRNEMVDEIVEQALVENLLEGNLFTPGDISTTSHNTSMVASNDSLNSNNFESSSVNSTTSTSFSNQTNYNNSNSVEGESNELLKRDKAESSAADESPMNILIRFVNEREMKIQAKPTDTILLIKRTHFETELSSNKIVRFIYQGQFLCDKNTIKSYNIKDHTTIHCHITNNKQAPTSESGSNETTANSPPVDTTNTSLASNPRARNVQTHQIEAINRINQMSPASTAAAATSDSPSTTDASTVPVSDSTPNTINTSNQQQQANITIINVELSHLLLPLFAILISSLWYFRVHFKHFFSPLSTLILVVFTFVYSVFLVNNVHATTTMAAANFFFHSRIWRSNRNTQGTSTEQQAQPATVGDFD